MTVAHIYDTHVKTTQGHTMHFDVVIDEINQEKALNHAKQWLKCLDIADASVEQHNCTFCHSAEAPPDLRLQIDNKGYAIIKLEGCST